MKRQFTICTLVAVGALVALAGQARAQVLYSQNFDVDNQSAAWNVNNGPGDEAHDFFFDYSTVGIPAAPGSAATTRGMKLQANLTAGVFTGMSVSPVGQSFTGDYKLTFDAWSNYIGNTTNGINNIGATTGSSNLSQFGIMTSGTVPVWPGTGDAVWFTAMSDTSSTAYRSYSVERVVSYKGTVDTDDPAPPPNSNYDPAIDVHNTYFATDTNSKTTRSNNPNSATRPAGQLYLDTFPAATVPASQTNADPAPENPSVDLSLTQFGTSPVTGVFGFKWHQIEISKIGALVTWKVDGTTLAAVDTASFAGTLGGNNILFGHSDINASTNPDPNFPYVQFTLIDNIAVTQLIAEDADFDNDTDVDATDFNTWKGTFGGAATSATGDANGDAVADARDFLIWQRQFTGPAVGVAVPEPANWCSAVVAAMILATITAPRRRLAAQRVVR